MLQRSASLGDCEQHNHVVTVGGAVTQNTRMLALGLGGPEGRRAGGPMCRSAGVPEGRCAGGPVSR